MTSALPLMWTCTHKLCVVRVWGVYRDNKGEPIVESLRGRVLSGVCKHLEASAMNGHTDVEGCSHLYTEPSTVLALIPCLALNSRFSHTHQH